MKPGELPPNALVRVTAMTGCGMGPDWVWPLARPFHAGTLSTVMKCGPWYSDCWDVEPLTADEEAVWRLTGKLPLP